MAHHVAYVARSMPGQHHRRHDSADADSQALRKSRRFLQLDNIDVLQSGQEASYSCDQLDAGGNCRTPSTCTSSAASQGYSPPRGHTATAGHATSNGQCHVDETRSGCSEYYPSSSSHFSIASDPSLIANAHKMAELPSNKEDMVASAPPEPGAVSLVGGYQAEFLQTVEENLKCCVCLLVLRNPVQTPCGHRFCQLCIAPILKGKEPRCPVDRKQLLAVFPDKHCQREVEDLPVKCNNFTQCNWSGKLQHLDEHLGVCPYESVECTIEGCPRRLERTNLSRHVEKECSHRRSACKYCDIMMPFSRMEDHLSVCPDRPESCPNAGCTAVVCRSDLRRHVDGECVQTMAPCKLGCEQLVRRCQLTEHAKDPAFVGQHMQGIFTRMLELEGQLSAKDDIIERQQFALKELREDLRQFATKVETPRQDKTTGDLQPRLDVCERKLADCHSDISVAMATVETIKEEQDVAKEERVKTDVLLDGHDLRILGLEKTSFSGTLIWRVDGFSRIRRDARNDKKLSHYSPPFFTGRHGYKACLRLYPDGDGKGKGKYISLFFVMMAGEFDPLLTWPFAKRVTLSLLDQSPSRRHISESFMPDPSSSSFHRPRTGMNVASGCPCFVAHTLLDTESSSYAYLRDDTLYLRASIDTTGLRHD